MKVLIFAIALALAISCTHGVNPGLIGGLKLPLINKMKAQFVPPIMEGFKQIAIDDMHMGDLSVTGITVHVDNNDHNNIKVGFNEGKNGLDIAVDNTYINVHVNWRYSKGIIKVSGVGDIKGPINHIQMVMGFDTQPKGDFLIPKVQINDFDMSLDKGQWNFHFDCKLCPSKVIDLIVNAFKGPLVDKIKGEAKKVVNSKVSDTVNAKLVEVYTTTTALNPDLTFTLATTGPISVKSTYLSVPFDGTVFLTKEGYSRPFDAPDIPHENPQNPGEIQLFASKYLYQTFEKSINKLPMRFDSQIAGYDVTFDVDGSKVPIEIDTRDKHLHVLGGGILTFPTLGFVFEVGASCDIDVLFRPGDSTNTIYVDPDVNRESLKLTVFKATLYGYEIDFTPFIGVVNYVVGFVINSVMLPPVAIAKNPGLPLTATAGVIDFYDTYTEAGVAFNFGIQDLLESLLSK